MKKVFLLTLMVMFSVVFSVAFAKGTQQGGFKKANYYGKWVEGNYQMEITEDTIFIDEIGNEGFAYTYDFDWRTNNFALYDFEGNLAFVIQMPLWREKTSTLNVILCPMNEPYYEELKLKKM